MMLRDFLRYPGVFKKSVQGKMCLFYRILKLCPREKFLKMRRIAIAEKSDLPPLIFKPHTVTNRSLIIRLLQSGHRKSVVVAVVVSRRKSFGMQFPKKINRN